MCDYKNANVMNIMRSLSSVNWERRFQPSNANNQVGFMSNCIVNTFHNFCPHKIVKCRYKDAPWMTCEVKQKFKNKYDFGYRQLLNDKMVETCNLIAIVKGNYYKDEDKKLLEPSLGRKKYCSILNSFLGNKKIPTIPPLFDNGEIITQQLLCLSMHPLRYQ